MKNAITSIAALLGMSGLPIALAQQSLPSVVTVFDSGSTAELVDLRRTDDGTTITVKGIFTNKSNDSIRIDAADISLADFKNKKKYLVIRENNGPCICSTAGTFLVVKEGASVRFWAKLAAPPEAVTAMSFLWGSAEPVLIPIAN